MIIRLPDVPQAEEAEQWDQIAKVIEEINELIVEITELQMNVDKDQAAILSEALDVIQAIAGYLALQDQRDLLNAMTNHTNKLKEKYGAKGYTLLMRRGCKGE